MIVKSGFLKNYKSCEEIKMLYDYKKSGFYWIKSECNKKPLRIFCDFHDF
jgi:hypothetical protein